MNRMNWLILVPLCLVLTLVQWEMVAHIKDRMDGGPVPPAGVVLPVSEVAHIKDFAPPPGARVAHGKDRATGGRFG